MAGNHSAAGTTATEKGPESQVPPQTPPVRTEFPEDPYRGTAVTFCSREQVIR